MSFLNKRVLVTGASRNTGLAIARRFAQEGAVVAINGSSKQSVADAAAAIRAAAPARLIEAPADLSDPAQIGAMFDRVRAECGGLDILVNNAVVQAIGHPFIETPLEVFERALRVNLTGAFLCGQLAARMMIAQRTGGSIVNVGSNVSDRPIRNRSAYCASKGGVDALTRAMAIELGPHGIRVNTVAPGYIHTDRWDALAGAQVERRRANVPLGLESSGDDIADAVLFMASDRASKITGARLVVDGGCSVPLVPPDAEV
ncbi:MAG: SDR family oxidoreductase [Verrucomicrobiae bacterium]|nr:SDR family oxidoreductase [Verrucomicrobiae bacterium]